MEPNSGDPARPECFGDMETVFPLGADGLREVSPGCWECARRIPCLKQAAQAPRAKRDLEEERQQRDDSGGVGGFLRRWSRLKEHARREGES